MTIDEAARRPTGRRRAQVAWRVLAGCALLLPAVLVGGWFVAKQVARTQILQRLDKLEERSQGNVRIEVGDIGFDFMHLAAVARSVDVRFRTETGATERLSARTVTVRKWRGVNTKTKDFEEIHVELEGVRGSALDERLGLGEAWQGGAEANVSLHATFDEELSKRLRIELEADLVKLGRLVAVLETGGVEPALLASVKAGNARRLDAAWLTPGNLKALAALELRLLRLRFVNEGYVVATMKQEAEADGRTLEQVRARWLEVVRRQTVAADKTWVWELDAAAHAFLDDGHSIEVRLDPDSPVPVSALLVTAMLSGSQGVAEHLGFEVEVNP